SELLPHRIRFVRLINSGVGKMLNSTCRMKEAGSNSQVSQYESANRSVIATEATPSSTTRLRVLRALEVSKHPFPLGARRLVRICTARGISLEAEQFGFRNRQRGGASQVQRLHGALNERVWRHPADHAC